MLIDTHAHSNFNAYKFDADEVIRRSLDNGVWMINVGSQYETSKRAVEIAERYKAGIYAAVGLHPIHLANGIFKIPKPAGRAGIPVAEGDLGTKIDQEEIEFRTREEDFDYEKYKALANSPKVVAIGEIGLDYYYRPKTKIKFQQFEKKQKEVFLKQLELAKELNLPIIFHCRAAHDNLITTLEHYNNRTIRGVVHCFTGTWEQAKKYLEMGFYLGFNGIIFKLNLDEIIKKTPLEKILIETDCPYLTPPPMNGRNEPLYVKYVAEKIVELKRESLEKITQITTENAKDLFRI